MYANGSSPYSPKIFSFPTTQKEKPFGEIMKSDRRIIITFTILRLNKNNEYLVAGFNAW